YQEYHACAMGEAAPKPKASAKKKKGDSASSTTPPTPIPTTTVDSAPRLSATAKGKQPLRATTPVEPTDVQRTEAEQLKLMLKRRKHETHISQQSGSGTGEGTESKDSNESDDSDKGSDNDSDETVKSGASKDGDEDDDEDNNDNDEEQELAKDDEEDKEAGKGGDEVRESKDSEKESDDEEEHELRLSEEARIHEEEDADELYRNFNINQGRGLQVTQNVEDTHVTLTPINPDGPQESSSMSSFVSSMLNPLSDVGVESIFTMTPSLIVSLETPTPIMTPSTIATITTSGEAPILPPIIPSIILENLPTFNSAFRFEERLRLLETSFSEYRQNNQFADAVSAIPGIVHQYMDQQMKEAVREAVQIQTDRLQDSLQRENDEFLRNIDENIKKAEVLTRSSQSSRTSYAVAADLTEMELKKILIKKMEGNKSIQRSNEQRNLYKALVDAYKADKTILESYGDTTILKRRRGDDDDDQEGPFAGSDRGSKRRREVGEPESASTPSKLATRSASRSTTGTQSRQMLASESAFAEEPVQTTCQIDEPSHPVFETGAEDQPTVQTSQHPEWFSQPRKPPTPDRDWNKTLPATQGSTQTWISELAKQADSRSSFNELLDTPIDFSNFIMNRLGVNTLTPKLLAGPTYELMRGSCTSLTELKYHMEEVYKATTDQLDWVNHKGQQYPHNLLQPLSLIPDNRGRRVIPFAHFINNDLEYLRGGASSRKYTTSMTKTKAADYGHIKWIEDLVPHTICLQGVSSLVAYGRSSTGSRKLPEEAQPNQARHVPIRSKATDGTFNDVRNALDDRLKGIRMQYLPQTIWRKGDKDRATTMIQSINKMLKTWRIMRSLERFVGGRLYEGDFRMLQRTI
nr:hypothetical protein [Tanacetum cinerariifolium]